MREDIQSESSITPEESASQAVSEFDPVPESINTIGVSDPTPNASILSKTRSVGALLGNERLIAEAAGRIIADYTLFQNPLPKSEEMLQLLDRSWKQAQLDLHCVTVRSRSTERWVCLVPFYVIIVGVLTMLS